MPAWVVWLAAAAVIWVPGTVIRATCGRRSSDALASAGETAALGIAFWPAAFLVLDLTGLRWNAFLVRSVVTVLTGACVALFVRRRSLLRKPHAAGVAALMMAGIVAWTRVLHVAGVALPLWVDSVHHTMIVRLLLGRGALPETYEPFIAASTFYYHWGFHALAAAVAWLIGATSGEAVATLLLAFGQFLNVVMFFAVYAGAKALFRSRRTALLAAVLATLVSYFPAYYVSWGRYTQLCGLLLLPVGPALFWETARHPRLSRAAMLALIAAGMLLVHVRVATVFAAVAVVLTAMLVVQRKWRGLAWCAGAGLAALLLASPWLARLATTPHVRSILAPRTATWETSDVVPPDLLWAPNNLALLSLATGGIAGLLPLPGMTIPLRAAAIAWWIALVVLLERRWRRRRERARRFDGWRIGVVAATVLVLLLVANGHRVGLPRVRIVPNSAAIIMLFLPLALIGAHLIRWAVDATVAVQRRRMITLLLLAIGIGVVGAWTMRGIINPVTVLATESDRRALEWVRDRTDPSARFAVGVQPWIGHTYVGNDGGYWVSVISDRASILPPGLYAWVMSAASLEATTELLDRWYRAQQTGDASVFEELRRAGFDYLYVGPRNETAIRAVAAASLTRVYAQDGVEIFMLARANAK